MRQVLYKMQDLSPSSPGQVVSHTMTSAPKRHRMAALRGPKPTESHHAAQYVQYSPEFQDRQKILSVLFAARPGQGAGGGRAAPASVDSRRTRIGAAQLRWPESH